MHLRVISVLACPKALDDFKRKVMTLGNGTGSSTINSNRDQVLPSLTGNLETENVGTGNL